MNLPSLPSKETFPGRGKSVWSSLAVTESGDQDGSPWEPLSGGGPGWNRSRFFGGVRGEAPAIMKWGGGSIRLMSSCHCDSAEAASEAWRSRWSRLLRRLRSSQ